MVERSITLSCKANPEIDIQYVLRRIYIFIILIWQQSNSSNFNIYIYKLEQCKSKININKLEKWKEGKSWSWSCGSLIYNYLCNQRLSPLTLRIRIPFMARCTRYNILVITFFRDLRQVGGFLWILRFPPPIKLTATIWLTYYWKWHQTP